MATIILKNYFQDGPLQSLGEQAYWKTECENKGGKRMFSRFPNKEKLEKRRENWGRSF